MKKFLLLTLCALFGMVQSAFAQLSITTLDGKEVQENDVVKLYAIEDPDFGGVEYSGRGLEFKATGRKCQVQVSIKIPADAAGVFSLCGLGVNGCQPVGPGTTNRSFECGTVISKPMDLHASFAEGEYVTYTVPVEVKVNGGKYRKFFVAFVYDQEHATGIEGVEAQNEGVKFMDNVCHYSFAAAAPRALQVYGMDGKLVYNTMIAAAEGSVSLNALQKGAYVYSIVKTVKKFRLVSCSLSKAHLRLLS